MEKFKVPASKYNFIKLDGNPFEYLRDHWDRSCSLLVGLLKEGAVTQGLLGTSDFISSNGKELVGQFDSYVDLLNAWSEVLGHVELDEVSEDTSVFTVGKDEVSECRVSGVGLFEVFWNQKLAGLNLDQIALSDLDFSLPEIEADSAYLPVAYAEYLQTRDFKKEIRENPSDSAKLLIGFLLAAHEATVAKRPEFFTPTDVRRSIAKFFEVLDYVACFNGIAGVDSTHGPTIQGRLGWDPLLKSFSKLNRAAIR